VCAKLRSKLGGACSPGVGAVFDGVLFASVRPPSQRARVERARPWGLIGARKNTFLLPAGAMQINIRLDSRSGKLKFRCYLVGCVSFSTPQVKRADLMYKINKTPENQQNTYDLTEMKIFMGAEFP